MKVLALKKQRLEQWSLEPGQSLEEGRVEKQWPVGTWAQVGKEEQLKNLK